MRSISDSVHRRKACSMYINMQIPPTPEIQCTGPLSENDEPDLSKVDSKSLWIMSCVRIANKYIGGTLEVAAEYVENGVRRATNDCVRKELFVLFLTVLTFYRVPVV